MSFDEAKHSRLAGKVRRFHTYQMIVPQDVAQHSFNVANLVRLMGGDKDTILAALYHDMGEWATGDIPSPVKRSLPDEARRAVETYEKEGEKKCGVWPYSAWAKEIDHTLLKVADNLEGLITAMEEVDRGNKDMLSCLDKYAEYLYESQREEIRPLVSHYLSIYKALR